AGVEYRDPEDEKNTLKPTYNEELVGGTKCFRSVDGGETWNRTAIYVNGIIKDKNKKISIAVTTRPFYFCPPRQDPMNPSRIYFPRYDGFWVSEDAGKSFKQKVGFGGDPHE